MLFCRSSVHAVAVGLMAGILTVQPLCSQTTPAPLLAKGFQKRFAHISKRYKLTAAQQTQVRSILLEEQQDQQTASADHYMSGKDKREESASLFEASQQKIGAILTTKQKRKFDADEKRRAWMDGRIPNPNPGPEF